MSRSLFRRPPHAAIQPKGWSSGPPSPRRFLHSSKVMQVTGSHLHYQSLLYPSLQELGRYLGVPLDATSVAGSKLVVSELWLPTSRPFGNLVGKLRHALLASSGVWSSTAVVCSSKASSSDTNWAFVSVSAATAATPEAATAAARATITAASTASSAVALAAIATATALRSAI